MLHTNTPVSSKDDDDDDNDNDNDNDNGGFFGDCILAFPLGIHF